MSLANHLLTISISIACIPPITFAQEARIPGDISDGKPATPAPLKELPKYNIKWSKVQYKHGRKVTINRIDPPVAAAKPTVKLSAAEIAERTEKWKTKITDIKESGGFVMVSATIYDHI